MKKITTLKFAFSLIGIVGLNGVLLSQPVFEKTYSSSSPDERGQFAGPGADGGIIICGKTNSTPHDAIMLKTDNVGAVQWSQKLTGSGDEAFQCIRPTTDGGYIAVGYTSTSGAGGKDVLLVKLTSTGVISWSKTYGTSTDDMGYDVKQTTDGGYIITGDAKKSLNSTVGAVYLIKTDNAGGLTWSNMWGAGIGNEGKTVIQTSDGGYFVAGNASNGFFYVIKTTGTGTISWARTNLATAMTSGNLSQAIQTADGGYALIGNAIATSNNDIDIALVKINSTGVVQWWKTYGGTSIDFGLGVQEISGNFLVMGYTTSFGTFSDPVILRVGSTGTLNSAKTTSGVGTLYDGSFLSKSPDGAYVYASTRNNGVYLFKSDGSGATGCNMPTAALTDNSFTAFMDNATTPNSSGTTLVNSPAFTTAALTLTAGALCNSVGILEKEQNEFFSMYPNPAHTFVKIILEKGDGSSVLVEIKDVLGKTVYSASNESNLSSINIDITSIPNGVYFLNVGSAHQSYTKALIIQH